MPAARRKRVTEREDNAHGENVEARSLCVEILREYENTDGYINLILNRQLKKKKLPFDERGFLTELVHGTIQRLNTIDWVLSIYLDYPLEKLTPWIRNILRMGVYQLLYIKHIPDSAAVDESVKLAHRYGHKGVASLVNGVLRKISREKDDLPWPSPGDSENFLSLFYSHPLWLVKRWLKKFGRDETEALCEANNIPPPFTIRTNTLRLTREALKNMLQEEGVQAEECRFAVQGLELGRLPGKLVEITSFKKGLFHIHGESSMLVAPALNPQPGETVLDLCSAPGGKTVHIAVLMENNGDVVAADLYPQRLKLVEKAAEHQGVNIIRTVSIDGRHLPSKMRSSFRRVLVDVPCSGLGVLRRKGDLKWRRQPEDILSLARLQLELLREGFSALAPGGILLYSACSIETEETVEVVNQFLADEPCAYLTYLSPFLPQELASEEKEEGMVNFWPHRHNLDGFFLARIRKKP